MYAIFKTGGKQYKAKTEDVIRVERLEAEKGKTITLSEVLFVGGDKPLVGTPTINGAVVEAIVVDHIRSKKIIVFKKKRRQNYRRKRGHRQHITVLKILKIKTAA